MSGPIPQDYSMMLYRITALEEQIKRLQEQLKAYVPARENDLQLQSIQSSVARIERDVIDMKAKQQQMEKEAREQIEHQQQEQAKIQIRVLVGIVGFIITIVGSVLTFYLTHIIK